jgi:DtxR family Mn-dependent transcriptional regulator
MQTSLREDLLEALLCLAGEGGGPITLGDLATQLRADPRTLAPVLAEMAREGEITFSNESAALTGMGMRRGRRVAHRHRVLQCFLSERLGIDGNSASREACRLEHQVTDEAVSRLSEMMGEGRPKSAGDVRPLTEFGEGDLLRVELIQGSSALARLMDLGVLPGEIIEVRRTLPNRAVVVRVKACDIALSPEIAASILVVKP